MIGPAKVLSAQMKALANKLGDDADIIIEKIVFALHAAIKRATPIDTGRARAGWQTEKTITGWAIFNNVEYIEALENGHSRQAPQGMVAINIANVAEHVRKIVAGYDGINAT